METSESGKEVDKDKTFNRLKEIQNLLKESSLNELCKSNKSKYIKNKL